MNTQTQHTPAGFEAALTRADEIRREIAQRESSLVAEIEAARVALGEHPDAQINLPERIGQIRQESRCHFHDHSKALDAIERLRASLERMIAQPDADAVFLARETLRQTAALDPEVSQ